MRIISGSLKGRSISVPKNFKGRPTTDFAREGLFNVLNHLVDFHQMDVLDLFSGTGAFAIECFSRGAEHVTCVDMQSLHVKFISDNFKQFNIANGVTTKQDVFKYIQQSSRKFDLIFADPPYDLQRLAELPDLIFKQGLLHDGGLFILEHPKQHNFEQHPHFLQEKRYSNVHFSFFRSNGVDSEEK